MDLITPDGRVLPKFNNFASAFHIAGTMTPPATGSRPGSAGTCSSRCLRVDEFTLTAAFVDDPGRIGMDQIKLKVDRSKLSGQALTPAPTP